MAEYIIPTGGQFDPVVPLSVNGKDQHVPTGQAVELADHVVAALRQSSVADELVQLPASNAPLASIDFKNGVYSIGGVSKTLDECCIEDLNWNAWDPATVVDGVGLVPADSDVAAPTFTAEIAAIINAGCYGVMTLQMTDPDDVDNEASLTQYDHGFVGVYQDMNVRLDNGTDPEADWMTRCGMPGLQGGGSVPAEVYVPYGAALYKAAGRFASNEAAVSLNGSPVNVMTADWTNGDTHPPDRASLWVAKGGTTGTIVVEKVELFDLDSYTTNQLGELSAL